MVAYLDNPNRSPVLHCASTMSDAPSKPAVDVLAAVSRPPDHIVAGNEIVLLAIKPSVWRPLFESAPVLAALGVLMLALSSLNVSRFGLSQSLTVKVLIAFGFGWLTLAFLRWIPTWYMLTNRRIITISGVRLPLVISCPLLDIRNTYMNATTAERLMGIGSISFVTDNVQRPPMYWLNVAKPVEVHAAIRKAIEDAIDRHSL